MQKSQPKNIIITGASSGIGEALALFYAAQGVVLGLSGRNAERLKSVARACEEKGAKVFYEIIDVSDAQAMEKWILDFDSRHPVDLAVANAGISAGTGGVLSGEPVSQVRKVFDVNLYGVLNTISPLIEKMQQRKRGQIAIMSSLAGYVGWAGAPAYCASKAAVRVYGQALRASLREAGVRVNVICPGFVDTRMTKFNDFPMPFIVNVHKAAKIIAKGLMKNKPLIAFPLQMYLGINFAYMMPEFVFKLFLGQYSLKSKSKIRDGY